MTCRWPAPTRIGDSLQVELSFSDKTLTRSGTRGLVTEHRRVVNQDSTVVLESEWKLLVAAPDRPSMSDARLSVEHGVAVLTLDRAPVNALSSGFYAEISAALAELAADDSAQVLVLTSSSPKAFCAGADVTELATLVGPAAEEADARRQVLARTIFGQLLDLPQPSIAVIDGPAIGAGAVIASCCDMRMGSARASFALPEVDVARCGGGRHLMRHLPQGIVRRMYFTATPLTSEDALRFGFLDSVHDSETLLAAALERASGDRRQEPARAATGQAGAERERAPAGPGRLRDRTAVHAGAGPQRRRPRSARGPAREARPALHRSLIDHGSADRSGHGTRGAQRADRLGVVAEFGQHLVTVLTDRRRVAPRPGRGRGQVDRIVHGHDLALLGVLQHEPHPVVHDLRIGENLLEAVDRAARHIACLQQAQPMRARAARRRLPSASAPAPRGCAPGRRW